MTFKNARTSQLLALFAGAAFALASVCPTSVQAAAAAGERIAVANVSRIFNEMQETKDLKEQLEAKRQDLNNQEKEKRGAIKEMDDHLHNIKPDSPQYKEDIEKLDKAMADLESWGKVVRLEAERDQKVTMRNLFEKIKAAVSDIAKQQGFDVVLADQGGDFPNLEQVNFDQLRAYINQQSVLFAAKGVDISDAVLTLLDANYVKQKGSK